MRYSILALLASLLAACTSNPTAENESGLPMKIEAVKNHGEGADITLTLKNTSRETVLLPPTGSLGLWLDGNGPIKGRTRDTVTIPPGQKVKFQAQFEFINSPKIYKKALVEILPQKVFRSCKAADRDPTVMQEEKKDPSREVAMEVEPLTCNRPLTRPIRLEY